MAVSITQFTRDDITFALIPQMVAAPFSRWGDQPITPAVPHGWDNPTFRLGTDMSVRLPSAVGYTLQVAKEHPYLPRLAPLLPLPIPVPIAQVVPEQGHPFPWSIYCWLPDETAVTDRIDGMQAFTAALAHFLAALQRIDPAGRLPPGVSGFRPQGHGRW